MRRCMKGKVTISLRVPVKAGDVSWGHDRRQGGGVMCTAAVRG